ncbi:MAG: hypothetical protein IJL85_05225 [Erysipelotrichaceae bacterium]|nr:hypothetical protein [Erysipelotrichaceae bacterium]
MRNRRYLKAFLVALLFFAIVAYAYRQKGFDAIVSENESIPQHTAKDEGYLEIGSRRKKPHHAETETYAADIENEREDIHSLSEDLSIACDPAQDPSSDDSFLSEPDEKGHWEYRDILVSEAWDEMVLVKDGYNEKILVSEAWDEEITYCAIFGSTMVEMEVCNTCGAQFQGGINEHLSQTGHSGWHNEYVAIDEPYCKSYDSYFIHHDAIYQDVWHDPEYEIVHHDAVYRTERYWVKD